MTENAIAPIAAPVARRHRGVLSIRWIVTAVAVGLTVAAVLGVGALAERNARSALQHEIEARLELQARNLAASSAGALLTDYPELTLVPLIRKILGEHSDVTVAVVVNHRGEILGHTDPRMLSTAFVPPAGAGAAPDPLSPDAWLRVAGDQLLARAPVLQVDGRVIGAAYVGLPLRIVGDRLRASRGQQALLLALLTVLGACLAFFVMARLLRPMTALRSGIERIARGDLSHPIQLGGRTELGLLADAVDDMAAALRSAQAEMLERERLAREVELARDIQRSLLPSQAVTAGAFEIRGAQTAAAEVGGDYWDVLPLPDGKVGIAIADVAGKGLAGCLVMSMLSALLRALRSSYTSPSAMLVALDAELSQTLRPGVFVTMCYGVLDPATGRLTFASAGHNPLLLWRKRNGTIDTFESRGIPLGAVRGGAIRSTLRDETLQMEPGDVCVQYTDGYSEAFQQGGDEQFGLDRIEAAVHDYAERGGDAVLKGLAGAVRQWSGDGALDDDETLVILSCEAHWAGAAQSHVVESADEAELRRGLELLARAEQQTQPLELDARLENLATLDKWTRGRPELLAQATDRLDVIVTALYEVCSNIVEHGCGQDGRKGLAVYWLPNGPGAPGGAGVEPSPVSLGSFVIRDGGRPFRPHDRRPTDFNDPAVRTKGRGIGLEIIHRVASRVSYHPATARGNITVLEI